MTRSLKKNNYTKKLVTKVKKYEEERIEYSKYFKTAGLVLGTLLVFSLLFFISKLGKDLKRLRNELKDVKTLNITLDDKVKNIETNITELKRRQGSHNFSAIRPGRRYSQTSLDTSTAFLFDSGQDKNLRTKLFSKLPLIPSNLPFNNKEVPKEVESDLLQKPVEKFTPAIVSKGFEISSSESEYITSDVEEGHTPNQVNRTITSRSMMIGTNKISTTRVNDTTHVNDSNKDTENEEEVSNLSSVQLKRKKEATGMTLFNKSFEKLNTSKLNASKNILLSSKIQVIQKEESKELDVSETHSKSNKDDKASQGLTKKKTSEKS
jgi:hypothetical protein